jgi:hypothetical protein
MASPLVRSAVVDERAPHRSPWRGGGRRTTPTPHLGNSLVSRRCAYYLRTNNPTTTDAIAMTANKAILFCRNRRSSSRCAQLAQTVRTE